MTFSRLPDTVDKGIERMETKSVNFEEDLQGPLDFRYKYFCLKDFTSGTNRYYMETRPIQQRNGSL